MNNAKAYFICFTVWYVKFLKTFCRC